MPDQAVVNASPLIFLSQAGLLDLLRQAASEIVVPHAVAAEIRKRDARDLTVQALDRTAWLKVIETPPVPSLIQAWDLGPGESSVLAFAHAYPGTVTILDDLAARR
jgi:predicted nucleic acid-binding protein